MIHVQSFRGTGILGFDISIKSLVVSPRQAVWSFTMLEMTFRDGDVALQPPRTVSYRLIPTNHSEKHIEETLESALNHDCKLLEIIVLDDGRQYF